MITTVQPYSANVICLWLSNSNTRLHSDAPGSEWTRAVDSLKQKLFSTGCIDAHQRIGNFAAHSEADVLCRIHFASSILYEGYHTLS